MSRRALGITVLALVLPMACLGGLRATQGDAPDAPERSYVGAARCRLCHPDQFGAWQKKAHAAAFALLKTSETTDRPECLPCHTTGMGHPSGFQSEEETPGLIDVQCEACHGPGSAHVAAKGKGPIDRDPPATVCLGCHHEEAAHDVPQ